MIDCSLIEVLFIVDHYYSILDLGEYLHLLAEFEQRGCEYEVL